jgi:competence protein ComK
MLIHEINAIYYDIQNKQSIIQAQTNFPIKCKPLELIDTMCNRYGLSGVGSMHAIKKTLKIHQKCPILVHPILQIYLFPTVSMKDHSCIWINSKRILKLKNQEYQTEIMFIDHTSILCNVGIRSIKKQLIRCEMMEKSILEYYKIDQLSLKL